MSVPLSELVSDVLREVTKCSTLLAKTALESAAIRFYKDSLAYNVTLDPIPIVVDTAEYQLVNPTGFQIISPRSAQYDRRSLEGTSEEALDLDWADQRRMFNFSCSFNTSGPGVDAEDWRYARSDRPGLYYCPTPNRLRLVGIPASAPTDSMIVNVYCHPTKGVTAIEDWIYNSWNEVIVLRAIADLKMMKDKTFYDVRGAAVAEEAYADNVGAIAAAALRGHQRNNRPNLRVKVWR